MRTASVAFARWVADSIAPIARDHGFAGKGPTFRKRDGDNWILFSLERRRLNPFEAEALSDDPRVAFRLTVGISVASAHPPRQAGRNRAPGIHDITMYTVDKTLDPPEGDDWHVFVADDPGRATQLTSLIADGLEPAIRGLGHTSARAILARRLSVTGPLENLSPGGAEELLAMADSAGDAGLRAEIVAALERERVPDPIDALRGGWVAPIGRIDPPMRPARQTRRMLDRLLAELRSDRAYARRLAANRLGGWDTTVEVLTELRAALAHPDGYTRGFAALSLGHLRDPDDATWRRVLALADDRDASAWEVGAAVALLAHLDPDSRRADGAVALDRLRALHPAWSPDLRAFKKQIAPVD